MTAHPFAARPAQPADRLAPGEDPGTMPLEALTGRSVVFIATPMDGMGTIREGDRGQIIAIKEEEEDVFRLAFAHEGQDMARGAEDAPIGTTVWMGPRPLWGAYMRVVADNPRRERLLALFAQRADPGQGWAAWLEERVIALDTALDRETPDQPAEPIGHP